MRAVRSKKAGLGVVAALALTSPLLVAGPTVAEGPTAHAAAAAVTITGTNSANFAFSPPKITVTAGKKVSWSWSGNAPHNVTFANGKGSATGNTGTFSKRFKAPGKFAYTCTVHGTPGKVVVK